MPSRALPNLGLQAFFDPGEDGWDDEMSLNLLLLSVLVQGGVMETVSATPGAPADGDVYLFAGDHPTEANKIAIRDAGAWIYVTPLEGWRVYDRTANMLLLFTGANWVEFTSGGGGGAAKYRFGFSIENEEPTGTEVLLRHVLQTSVDFAEDFAGSVARLSPGGANPATNQVFDILLNGSPAGTLTIATTGTITWDGTTFIGAAGDEIRVEAPAAPDPALVGLSVIFYGVEA